MGQIELHPPNSNLDYDLKPENFQGGPEIFNTILKSC